MVVLTYPRTIGERLRAIDLNYWGEFRSQVPVVGVAPEGDWYLFTLGAKAWCYTITGETV